MTHELHPDWFDYEVREALDKRDAQIERIKAELHDVAAALDDASRQREQFYQVANDLYRHCRRELFHEDDEP